MSPETSVRLEETVPNSNSWNHCVENAVGGTPFHRAEWLSMIEEHTPLDPVYAIAEKQQGNIVGLYPFFGREQSFKQFSYTGLDSLPRSEFGGPCLLTEKEGTYRKLLDAVRAHAVEEGYTHLETTLPADATTKVAIFEDANFRPEISHCDLVLPVGDDIDEILSRFHRERRRETNRSLENDEITITESPTDSFDKMYEMYVDTIEAAGGIAKERGYIKAVVGSKLTQVYAGRVNGDLAAWMLHLVNDDDVYNIITGSDPEYHSSYIVQRLHHESLAWSVETGREWYHLGGTPADFRDSLYEFKSRWNPSPQPKLSYEQWLTTPKGVGRQALMIGRQLGNRFNLAERIDR